MATSLMEIGELSHSIGARRVAFSANSCFSSVSIDSRNVEEGCLFFALEGASRDGHSFVSAAFNAGARAAVVSSAKLSSFDLVNTARKKGKDLIIVENTLKGLQDSAKAYLKKFPNMLKIGITGSSGKTTTKEIAGAIIATEKNTVMNKGNMNSETGLPLSVFQTRSCHEAGIFELGMNRRNEILETADVLKPNIALVTNIGTAHIEYFGDKLEILKEKKCIYKFLKENDVALVPGNDEYASSLAEGVGGKVKFYGMDAFAALEKTRSLGLDGTEITWAGEKIRFALPGKHSLQDAIAAIAIAREIPVSDNAIKEGLESVKPLFGRLEILKGRATVIRDCYNASPESMEKSLDFCDSLDWNGRKVYVIGDMLELGTQSREAHSRLGSLLADSKADGIFLFGGEVKTAASFLESKGRSFFHTDDIGKLSKTLDSYAREGDLVLLKGSRGCALERLTDTLMGGKI